MVRRARHLAGAALLACFVGLIGASSAEAVPSVTFKCTPAPEDCNGWFRSDVAIDWTVIPSDAAVSGCEDKVLTADTPGTNEFCRADDGSADVTVQFRMRVDQTAPAVTGGEPGRPADANGWYNRAVPVTFGGSDLTSGVHSCTATTYGGPDDGAASVTGTCTDNAGNVSAPFPYGLKYDETAPGVTGVRPERSANAHGWFNRPVRFDVQGADDTSGIANCPFVGYDGPDSASASITGRCEDRAGNAAERTFPLRYDATSPDVTSAQPGRAPDANGWYNRAVAVAFRGADNESGVEECTTVTYSGPDAAAGSVPGTCMDMAGNESAPAAFALQYDGTKPVVTSGRPARAADSDGWYNHAVDVAFTGTDQTAGVQGCSTATYAGPDTEAGSLAGTCTDRAGNVSDALRYGLKYDATDPTVTEADPDRPPNGAGWFNRPVGFTIHGSDETSGIAACPGASYAGPDAAAASVTGTCRDRAGNSATGAFPVKYDATAPEVLGATPERRPNADGWYNRSVSLTFAGRDTTSGVGSCTTRAYGGPDREAASITGTCTDRAGNVSGDRPFSLNYDATPPTIDRAAPARTPDANGWYNRPVSVAFTGSDGTSGVAGCTSGGYDGPDSRAASVSGTCADRAGNTSGPLSFSLKYDATAPQVTAAFAERPPDRAGWYVSPVRFDFTGADATSGVEACPPVTYAGPDGGGAVLAGRCRDSAGNSSVRAFPLDYDATPPPLTDLTATGGDRNVSVSWRTSEDAQSVQVRRSPGAGGEPASTVFSGPGSSFVDRQVENGVRYAYEVRLRDAAGNVSEASVIGVPAVPAPVDPAPVAEAPAPAPVAAVVAPAPFAVPPAVPRIAPPAGAVLVAGKPPLLEWPAVSRARYYNVQLFRGGRKILTVWPTVARYQLKLRWTYRGRRLRLSPGRYRWLVWPGYGPRVKANYGERIAKSTFQVTRAP